MTVDDHTLPDADQSPADQSPAPLALDKQTRRRIPGRGRAQRPRRPRVRKLRLLFVIAAFGVLAVISTLFGALTSIASDLPRLENTVQFSHTVDSYMYDDHGHPIGPLAPASTPAIDRWGQISPNMRNAIVAVEDRGFWHESGISVRGLLRAGLADLDGNNVEGGSTIPEEFVKNVNSEEDHRTVAEKLVEAGMAFQLSHHWTHKHILTEYLNTIYFGNGALGIEAAARVYFGWDHGYNAANPVEGGADSCGNADPQHPDRKECASVLTPAQAALLAGMVANPSAFNPAGDQQQQAAAKQRRNLVLQDMLQQHYISYQQFQQGEDTNLPTPAQIQQPEQQPTTAPYFTSWVEPRVVNALEKEGLSPKQAQYEADYGGLKIKLSIDLNMQTAAQDTVNAEFPADETGNPTASLVAIDNRTGEVRAMVSGNGDYDNSPFNLATMGYRQPGSSFKIFTLAAALSKGAITPYSEVDSQPITIHFVKKGDNAYAADNGTGRFPVHNFGNEYSGLIPMTLATAISDNSVFAQVGTKVGTASIAHYAHLMGIRSPIDPDPSMILGGLTHGVSALDMAHAYSTVANDGKKVYNPTLGDVDGGPIGIDSISGITGCAECRHGKITNAGTLRTRQVISTDVASTIGELLHGPVDDSYGTGTEAAIPGVDVAGKTGTTSNYVDAWFVGWTPTMTVAVWVGYPDSGKPMLTNYGGQPVEGGTFPAVIWHNFMVQAIGIMDGYQQHKDSSSSSLTTEQITPSYTAPSTSSSSAGASTTSSSTSSTTPSAATSTAPAQTQVTTPAVQQATTPATPTTTPASSSPAVSQTPTTPASTSPPAAPTTRAESGSSGGSGL
jgi:penicillin-binding protein 1A